MRTAAQPSEVPRGMGGTSIGAQAGIAASCPGGATHAGGRGLITLTPIEPPQLVFPCAESHRRLDAVLLHIKARARQLAVVMLQSNHEYRGAGHQEAAVARGVREDRGGRVNRVFGFSPLVTDFDDVALRRLANCAD